jgi:hypothetical protein
MATGWQEAGALLGLKGFAAFVPVIRPDFDLLRPGVQPVRRKHGRWWADVVHQGGGKQRRGGGHLAMPELADLSVVHSGRGYQPMPVSHHQAQWWSGHIDAPPPMYPGQEWEGRTWNRGTLRDFYQPWRDVEAAGASVHIGECGCYNKTANDIALRWFNDLFGLYKKFGWGYALWNFAGDFGIVEHGRPGARYEELHGYKVDRELLDLLIENRTTV